MSLATASLPSDPNELRAFAVSLQLEMQRQIAARDAEIYAKTLHIEKLRTQLSVLRRARYGRSSEKLDREIEQLEFVIGDLEESHAESEKRTEAADTDPAKPTTSGRQDKKKERGGRKPLPDHLPCEEVVHEPACCCPTCGGTVFSRLGQDEREVLEYVPSYFKRVVHIRPKQSCRSCETIVQAPMPSLPIERGRPGPNLLAHVLIAKYCDHLPLHRQSVIYARAGVELDRSVMASWVGEMAFLLDPLVQAIGRHARAGHALHTDDTPVPVLSPGLGRTKTGRLWVVVRDERPFGSSVPPAAFYRYSPDRKGKHAEALLGDCRGFLHADGYAGFNGLYAIDPITQQSRLVEVACWSHARRKLYDVHVATSSPAAKEALERIGELFAVEADIKGQSAKDRRDARRERSVPILDELKIFLEATLAKTSNKSSLAQAIRYATTRWEALKRFTTDGRLDICNNAAERAIRPLALGRRNWTFAGSDTGGQRAAAIYTLIETAKMNRLDPEAYLADVIARIADYPINQIEDLLPWNWQPPDVN
ncbi:MAG: IS66 family transposase [Geminicoccaceae bacterium]